MPKSRTRTKAVYTPPPRSVEVEGQPAVAGPHHAGLPAGRPGLDRDVLRQQRVAADQRDLGSWNLVVGFGFLVGGVVLSTKWH